MKEDLAMLNNVRERMQSYNKHIKTGMLITGVCVVAVISYRLGAQHGVDVFDTWLSHASPDLHKQVDALYKQCM